jgi:hypothetical protein
MVKNALKVSRSAFRRTQLANVHDVVEVGHAEEGSTNRSC